MTTGFKKTIGLVAVWAAMWFLISEQAVAQDGGTVRGSVIDSGDDDALIGANVLVEGTDRGTSTGLDGEFVLRNVPAGEQTLIVTYVGYDRKPVDIVVEPGEETEITVRLSWSGLTGDEVTISGQARGQTSAINEQLRSSRITNIVSSDRIRELPDDNAATALSRIPGVSLQEGDKVVIRGMEAKMNAVSVGGVQLPSTDVNDRSTNLGFISANMLDGIEVTKSVTSDMQANATGGSVDLRLREAPDNWEFDGLFQGSYNTQDRTYPGQNLQSWASISNRFLDGNLGVFVQGNYSRSDGGADIVDMNYDRFRDEGRGNSLYRVDEVVFSDEVSFVDQYGGSVIMDYRLPEGKISMQNTIAATNNDLSRHRDILDLSNSQRQYRIERNDTDRQLLINTLQGEYAISDLDINFGASHALSQQETNMRYGDQWNAITFENRDQTSFPSQNRREITIDEVYDIPLVEDDYLGAIATLEHGPMWEDFQQRELTGNLDFTFPVEMGPVSARFKTGGHIKYSARENDFNRDRMVLNDPGLYPEQWMIERGMNPSERLRFANFRDIDYYDDRGQFYLANETNRPMEHAFDVDLLDDFTRAASDRLNPHESDSRANDFTADETITSGYVMGTFDIGSRLTLTTGVRYEHFDMDYDAEFVRETHGVYGEIANYDGETEMLTDSLTTVQRDYGHFFPNVQARVTVTDWLDVRAAYTQTITRPDYSMLVPNVVLWADDSAEAGNPYLDPTIAENFDLNFSFSGNRIGLFTVGLFYKELENVFYGISRLNRALPEGVNFPQTEEWDRIVSTPPGGSVAVDTYMNNPNPAEVRGIELDWQANFWFLPSPLNSMVLNVNYTRTFSEMDYYFVSLLEETVIENGRPVTRIVEEDYTRNARLLNQSDHILNVILGMDYRGFSGRVSYRMQDDVITSVGVRAEDDWFAQDITGWDVSMQQRLPIDGLSVTLNAVNITHNPTRSYREFRRYEGGEAQESPTEQVANLRYDPRRFELGLRYRF